MTITETNEISTDIAPPRRKYLALLLILLLAFAARFLWMLASGSASIFNMEELEYLRIAQNLLTGTGYMGLYGTPQIVHTPLYPLTVTLVGSILHDIERAGIIVSLIAGVCLSIPLYFLAKKLYGARTAILATILAALLPYLVWLSSQTISESFFLVMLTIALLCCVYAIDMTNIRIAIITGVAVGLAYLARPTAIVIIPLILTFMFAGGLSRRLPFRKIILHLLAVVIPFGLLAAPYILFLHDATGHWMADGKSTGLRAQTLMIYAGVPESIASWGIDENLVQLGFDLDQTAYTISLLREQGDNDDPVKWITETLRHLPQNSSRVLRNLIRITSPLIVALCLLALIRIIRDRRHLLANVFLLTTFFILLFIQVTIPWFQLRYLAPLMPFILLWTAAGLDWLITFLSNRLSPRLSGNHRSLIKALALAGLFVVLFSTYPSYSRLMAYEKLRCFDLEKEAGLWLKQNGTPPFYVMDDALTTVFYSGGTVLIPPFTDEDTALRYIEKRRPTHIALSNSYCEHSPYTCEWLENGVPDERAVLLQKFDSPGECRVSLYQWEP